ncbi:DUF4198 domain-containing protein [Aminobacterium mobile]|mgnify:CR=1 FL=1|jgi:uncharacterized GH25 family protein
MVHLVKRARVLCLVMSFVVLSIFLGAPGAHAHDFWINAKTPEGDVFKAEIGYGHNFPHPEPIAEGRTGLFDVLHLVKPDGVMALTQSGENYAYQCQVGLEKGDYLVTGIYKPTFWAKGPDGWAQKNRIEYPSATYVEEAAMFAKTIFNVGGATSNGLISKAVGHRLEIVPQVNPATVKVGGSFPVQVLFDGKPLQTAQVTATFADFSDKEYKAFQGRTDLKGFIDIVPLRSGYWFAKVEHSYDYGDKTKCDEVVLVSTLSFYIND